MPRARIQLKAGEGKRGDTVYVGITTTLQCVITEVVNEFQVEVRGKRDFESGRGQSWLVDITSLYAPAKQLKLFDSKNKPCPVLKKETIDTQFNTALTT